MKGMIKNIVAASIAAIALNAHAGVLTFDDFVDSSGVIPSTYGGFGWDNGRYFNANGVPSGYLYGRVSGEYVALNSNANPLTVFSSSSFDFNGAFLTAAWNNGLTINVKGFSGTTELYSRSVLVSTTNPTYFNFNYVGIDKLVFSSFGGTSAGYRGSGAHFAMDNFTFNEAVTAPVPEPETYAMLMAGLGLVGFMARRRKQKA